MNGDDLDELLQNIPDEFNQWIRNKRAALEEAFNHAMITVEECLREVENLDSRKDQASLIMSKHKALSSVIFKTLDGKRDEAEKLLWKNLKPEHELPKTINEE